MKIALSLVFIIFYWSIDSIYTSSILQIPFTQSLFHSNLLSKIFVTTISLAFIFFTQQKKSKEQDGSLEDKEFTVYQQVSKIITSPLSITKQANQINTLLQSQFLIDYAFICEYQTDKIDIINSDENLQAFGIKNSYNPHSEAFEKGGIEEIMSLFFLEKRDYLEQEVNTLKGPFQGYFHALISDESTKPFGLFILLCKENTKYSHLIKSISSLIAFSLFLHQRKVASEEFQKLTLQKDETLGIPTNTVLQTYIQQEYNRFLRYGTNLSLIVFEIDYLENLQNIFDKEVVLKLQKEFVTVISKNLRSNDMLGKWTKNRFAIVAPMIDFRNVKNVILKIKRVLEEQRFPRVGKITCSYGATSLGKGDTIVEFRRRAENALQEALRKDGNTHEIKVVV